MHKAKACVITCMDFRFHDKIQAFLEEKGYLGHSDLISFAGCSRDFMTPVEETDGKYAWKQLGLSVALHDPDEIVFIDHQDCGGYGQDDTIPTGLDKDEDISQHKSFSQQVKALVEEKYPGKVVKMLHAPFDGEIEEIA